MVLEERLESKWEYMPLTQNVTPHTEFCIAIPYVKTLSGRRTRYLRILRERKEKEENFSIHLMKALLSAIYCQTLHSQTSSHLADGMLKSAENAMW